MEFYRFEPYLRHALQEIVAETDPGYINNIDKGQRYVVVLLYVL